MVADLAKRLRRATGYPWRDCIEAANRTSGYWLALEMLPVIHREREKPVMKRANLDLP